LITLFVTGCQFAATRFVHKSEGFQATSSLSSQIGALAAKCIWSDFRRATRSIDWNPAYEYDWKR